MIDFRELRIGNWIDEQGQILQVGQINQELFRGSEPIPLTEEWLERLGVAVVSLDGYGPFIDARDKKIGKWEENRGWEYVVGTGGTNDGGEWSYVTSEVKYVHQLQNLFFALTGEELTQMIQFNPSGGK